MATRQTSFRARPIDITSQLALLRDPDAIKDEQVVQREVTHARTRRWIKRTRRC